jgi:hypothetical protein
MHLLCRQGVGFARTTLDGRVKGHSPCDCSGAGMPCERCNMPTDGGPPRLPAGFETEFDKDGWRH